MNHAEIRWNQQARDKILSDADQVLRIAVLELASSMAGSDPNEVFAALNARLKDQFIDYEPGPDVRKYADAVAAGQIES